MILKIARHYVLHNQKLELFIIFLPLKQDVDDLKENLIQHLTKPVLWSKTMNYIQSFDGIVAGCGPGKVLTGLAKSNGVKYLYLIIRKLF